VTSPGVAGFAPRMCHSGMPRLFTATASLAIDELQGDSCFHETRMTLCALQLGEPTRLSFVLTPFQRDTFHCASNEMWASIETGTSRCIAESTGARGHPIAVSSECRPHRSRNQLSQG